MMRNIIQYYAKMNNHKFLFKSLLLSICSLCTSTNTHTLFFQTYNTKYKKRLKKNVKGNIMLKTSQKITQIVCQLDDK